MLDFATLTLPKSPNTYLLAPADLCRNAKPHAIASVYPIGPMQLATIVRDALVALPNAEVKETQEGGLYLEAHQLTPRLKYRDDVTARILPAQGGATLALYSRSRKGYWDLGVNKKRVQGLMKTIERGIAEARAKA